MSPASDPSQVLWWLVSRASGIVAVALISLSVVLGLAMATRVIPRSVSKRSIARLHEHVALAGLVAITVHGLALLGDTWLHPGLGGIAIPFTISYRPLFTGLGIIGGYLAALLGLSFYARRKIGARLWRKLHRATVLVYLLGAVHTLGAGTDSSTWWLRGILVASAAPIIVLTMLRLRKSRIERSKRPALCGPTVLPSAARGTTAAPREEVA